MKISGIYKIESKIKPIRIYIGSAVNINNRWNLHLSRLRRNKHSNIKLQNHFNKYGESDLLFSVLLGCEKKDLLKVEQYFLDSYKPHFNIALFAGSPNLGCKMSDEQKIKLSKAHKGQKAWNKGISPSNEIRLKISNALKGRIKSDEECRHISEAQKGLKLGKKLSLEHRNKISEAGKGRVNTEETKRKMSESAKLREHRRRGVLIQEMNQIKN